MIIKTISVVFCTATAAIGAKKSLMANYGPSEKPHHRIGEIVIHGGRKYKIIGATGHHLSTIKEGLFRQALYIGPYHVAHPYANMNGKGNGAVAYIAVPVESEHKLVFGQQRFEGMHAPITADSLQKAGARIHAVQPASIHNDPSTLAALRRCLNEKFS